MGGFRHRSGLTPFVQPSPRMVVAGITFPGPPFFAVRTGWSQQMDTGVTPALASFDVVVDGVPLPIASWVWASPFFSDITVIFPAPVVSGFFRYNFVDVNLRNSSGTIAVAPQIIQFFP